MRDGVDAMADALGQPPESPDTLVLPLLRSSRRTDATVATPMPESTQGPIAR
jgi:hypothetical protein